MSFIKLLSEEEAHLFSRWAFCDDLSHNDEFWEDAYKTLRKRCFNIPMPLVYNEHSVVMLTEKFKCQRCSDCCRFEVVPFSNRWEVQQIADYIKIPEDEFRRRYVINERNYICLKTEGGCPFLKDNECSVYEVRPSVCRLSPIQKSGQMISVSGKQKNVLTIRVTCRPAMDLIRSVLTKASEHTNTILLPNLNLVAKE